MRFQFYEYDNVHNNYVSTPFSSGNAILNNKASLDVGKNTHNILENYIRNRIQHWN